MIMATYIKKLKVIVKGRIEGRIEGIINRESFNILALFEQQRLLFIDEQLNLLLIPVLSNIIKSYLLF